MGDEPRKPSRASEYASSVPREELARRRPSEPKEPKPEEPKAEEADVPKPEEPRAEKPAETPAERPPAAASYTTSAAAPRPPSKKPREAPKTEVDPSRSERWASLRERLRNATEHALRTRRDRIDRRVFEIGLPIGEAALEVGHQLHVSRIVDVDRVLKKIDRVDNDISDLERGPPGTERPEGFLRGLSSDLARLPERFSTRELKQKRTRLVAELGLALLAAELRILRVKAPDIAALVEGHAADARTVDELFLQSRFVDEELEARAREGRLDKKNPKALERLVSKTGEALGDVGDAAKDKLVDLGKTAARAAVKTSGKAVMGLAKGALGIESDSSDDASSSSGEDDEPSDERPRRKKKRAARDEDDKTVPELLRELGKLHRDGVLTDEEFARKKAELLKRL